MACLNENDALRYIGKKISGVQAFFEVSIMHASQYHDEARTTAC